MISTYFDRTLKYYGIQAKTLSQMTGVSENHISEFRRGKLRSGMTTTKLWELLIAMDQLEPGSKQHFCMLMAEINQFPCLCLGEQLEQLIEAASDEDLNAAIIKIGQVWKQRRSHVLSSF
jgi:hypothetical protein